MITFSKCSTESFLLDRDGFLAYGLRSSAIEVQVVPALGACVASLYSVRSGREWMWQGPENGRLFSNSPGDRFECSPLVGAVECVPTIAPGKTDAGALPDHGEAWSVAWRVDQAQFERQVIETSVTLPVSGLELTRRMMLAEATLHFEYRLHNRLSSPVPYIWAFHPLLKFEGEGRIELPEEVTSVAQHVQFGLPDLGTQSLWEWPEPAPGIRLDLVRPWRSDGGPTFAKLFADFSGRSAGWAALVTGDERLVFRFDPTRIPHLGIWVSNRGWNGYTHVAIEPSNATSDSLAKWQAEPLEPHAHRTWGFEISLHRR
jgi:galactose mutarotase-like enzyme